MLAYTSECGIFVNVKLFDFKSVLDGESLRWAVDGSDADLDGVWRSLVTGEVLMYLDWYEDEPEASEDCLILHGQRRLLSSEDCSANRFHVCEFNSKWF